MTTTTEQQLTPDVVNGLDFKVADLSLADYGRRDIELSEQEMPGLMSRRREYHDVQPLKGARVSGSLHMTVQTAVLIETLTSLGAEVRWASCNIFSTQDHAAAAVVVGKHGTPEKPEGARVVVTEIDPINALQALMEGFDVVTVEQAIADADIVVTSTGNKDIISLEHMKAMKDHAILGKIGHFDNEIDMAALERSGATRLNIKPQVDLWTFGDTGRSIIVLSEGRLLNLGNATGHPSFVMRNSFANQTIAQ